MTPHRTALHNGAAPSLVAPSVLFTLCASSLTPSPPFRRSVFLFTPAAAASASSVASRSPIGGSDLSPTHDELKRGNFCGILDKPIDSLMKATPSDISDDRGNYVGSRNRSKSKLLPNSSSVQLLWQRKLLQPSVRALHSSLYVKTMKATPELEYGWMNIGSCPSKRKPSGGIESLRTIPRIFTWTQMRFHLLVWLGFGAAFKYVVQKDIKNLHMLQEMYGQWPFFKVTIDLVKMVFAKGDPGIAALYDKLLVSELLQPFGEHLRAIYEETKDFLLQITGHKDLLEGDPYLKQTLRLHDAYITILNVCQAYTLTQIRDPDYHVKLRPNLSKEYMESSSKPVVELMKLNPTSEYALGLEDTLILTMKGIATSNRPLVEAYALYGLVCKKCMLLKRSQVQSSGQ